MLISTNELFIAPLKGIPSRVPTSGFRSSVLNNTINNRPPLARITAGRKEGGVKLLDIADQPLGYAAAKKRKKLQDIEDAKKNTEPPPLQSPPPVSTATPDYAAGLSSTPAYAPPTPQPTVTPTSKKYFNLFFLFFKIYLSLYFSNASTTCYDSTHDTNSSYNNCCQINNDSNSIYNCPNSHATCSTFISDIYRWTAYDFI